MANILSIPICGGVDASINTGVPFCDVIRKQPAALILVDGGLELAAADMASITTVVTFVKTATRASRGVRAYPILSLSNFEDKSKEATKAAIGNLSIQEITMQEGIPSFTFEHYKGELFHNQLSKAQNAGLKMFIVDSAYVMYGTKTSSGNLAGFTLAEFYVQLAKFATATTPAKYPFDVTLESITEYKDNLTFVQLDKTIMNISGNRDTKLTLVSQAANVAHVSVITGGTNLGDRYPTQLAATAAWVATNKQTGASVTITSVTYDSNAKDYIVTVDSTAYTSLSTGQKMTINLAAPAALTALGVDGFESTGGVDITKP